MLFIIDILFSSGYFNNFALYRNRLLAEHDDEDDETNNGNEGDEDPAPSLAGVAKTANANSDTGNEDCQTVKAGDKLNSDEAKYGADNEVYKNSHPIIANRGATLEISIILPHFYVAMEKGHNNSPFR